MATAQTGATLTAHGIDLVNEDNARRAFLGFLEHVTDPGGAHADEHFDKVGTRNGEERYLSFACYGAGQQSLAGAGRPHHQGAARNHAAQFLKLAGIAQEVDHFLDFFLGFVAASHVIECDLDLILFDQLGFALAEIHGATAGSALHPPHEVNPDADQQQHREGGHEQLGHEAGTLGWNNLDVDMILEEIINEVGIARIVGGEAITVGHHAADHIAIHADLANGALIDGGNEIGVSHGRVGFPARAEVIEHRQQRERYDDPQEDVLRHVFHVSSSTWFQTKTGNPAPQHLTLESSLSGPRSASARISAWSIPLILNSVMSI